MAARSRVVALGLAVSSVAGTVLMRRRRTRLQTRVDLYFEDGSMLSLGEDTTEAGAIVPTAREILAAR
jgi:hypothetical protein